MHRYFICSRYDGAAYHGRQVQPNGNPVQTELQQAVSVILRESIVTVGAGRADAGMHARKTLAHFDFHAEIDAKQLTCKLNCLLLRGILVLSTFSLSEGMHAHSSAKWCIYHYYIHLLKNPFLRHYSCQLPYQLDSSLMNEAASHLLRVEDFGAFCKSNTDVKTTLCHAVQTEWVEIGEDAQYFAIKANRFLRNMMRAVVSTLIEVDQHRMILDEFDAVARSGSRTKAGENIPANALFLRDVEY